ncbi:polysaccharide deacetylase family protein [Flavobacterium sp. SORGH_AS_0622]|uniref:polysaccharide deacetylase family protein n=1 Tax=Flavobacterium sp. SORGH_AS_0622 TaxID=3041772 RepID=UPI0027834A54|nr:polysaccharide deacetylase family protein [Flavobacterium sp. SORGH_AS_0622]MDQ1166944.1 peptidoglycan/xylan/chitin deacetylase (PgdA/CDA1 family) [Flavobacterium sp. SORGH_AS_0622]
MKLFFLKTMLFLMFLSFFSCNTKNEKPEPKPYKAGVILSFDDAYVDEWAEADAALKKYSWKATFNVCRIDSIGEPQIKKLLQMQKEGHEIAGHGYHHYNAVKFVQKNGIDEYMKQEIEPMIASMKKKSFNVTSFAYPYGERSQELDKALSSKFKIIRGRAFGGEVPEKQDSYFNNSKIVFAFDIDNSHIHFSIPYLLELLDYAKKNDKILILCSHKPVKNVTENYQTKIETLEFVCKYMKLNGLKFYTLSDLDNLLPEE